jgi:hypothetical protein
MLPKDNVITDVVKHVTFINPPVLVATYEDINGVEKVSIAISNISGAENLRFFMEY